MHQNQRVVFLSIYAFTEGFVYITFAWFYLALKEQNKAQEPERNAFT